MRSEYREAYFAGTRTDYEQLAQSHNVPEEPRRVKGFPYACTFLYKGMPVVWANDKDNKESLFKELNELNVEVVNESECR